MKKLLVLFSLVIVIAGVFASQSNTNEPQSILASDTTSVKTDTVDSSDYLISDQTQEKVEEEVSKSNILIKGKDNSGFSFVTILRGLLGMVVIIILAWIFSADRKNVDWVVIGKGLAIQLILAISILYIPFVAFFFEFVGKIFVKILDFTDAGSTFLFGSIMDTDSMGMIFAFQILPTIIFFSALTSVLFYWGIIQVVVKGLAWLMIKAMKLSGTESLSVAGNIFLGQTESPLMIKAYLPKMNDSEMLLVMIGGMATVAGGVLAAYIGFLGGDDPVQRVLFAKHLLTASVMAAPGAVIISKILLPQTQEVNKDIQVSMNQVGSNFLDALSNGTLQ